MVHDGIYLTVGPNPRTPGLPKLLAVITRGQPQIGDMSVLVLSVEAVNSMKEAKTWYRRMMHERPWEQRQ